MNTTSNSSHNSVNHTSATRRYLITGSQKTSNYLWASVITLGGFAFLLTGLAAFLNTSFLVFNQTRSISFLPQGLIMCFYGSLGLVFGVYLWCTILWNVGFGFNEFNKKQGLIRIFRWGLPGNDRRIDLVYQIQQVEGVRVQLKEGINPRRTIALRLKGNDIKQLKPSKQNKANSFSLTNQISSKTSSLPNSTLDIRRGAFADIPLTRIEQFIALKDIESEASELAQFLQVPLDNFYEL